MKGLKPRLPRTPQQPVNQDLTTEAMLEIVDQHSPHLIGTTKPTKAPSDADDAEIGMLNVRLRISTLDAIATAAERQGLTQKQIVCRGLAAIGLEVAAVDLEDKSRRRRRRK